MPLTRENSLTGNIPNRFLQWYFSPQDRSMKVARPFVQLLVKELKQKRPLLNSFIVTTACWNQHAYISITLLPSTCLSPEVMKINWKEWPQQLPASVNSTFTCCATRLWVLVKKYHLNKHCTFYIYIAQYLSLPARPFLFYRYLCHSRSSVNLCHASCRDGVSWKFALRLPSCGHRNLSSSAFTAPKQIRLGKGNLFAIPWAVRDNLGLWLSKGQVVLS